MNKHVHSKGTYILRVHLFTTQQEGEGNEKETISLITQNSILSMHKHGDSKVAYLLSVYKHD